MAGVGSATACSVFRERHAILASAAFFAFVLQASTAVLDNFFKQITRLLSHRSMTQSACIAWGVPLGGYGIGPRCPRCTNTSACFALPQPHPVSNVLLRCASGNRDIRVPAYTFHPLDRCGEVSEIAF